MAEGDLYVFSNTIQVEINAARVVNPFGVDLVQGCVPHRREPSLVNWWGLTPGPELEHAPLDEQGRPMVWCQSCEPSFDDPLAQWHPIEAFGTRTNRKGESVPKSSCKACEARERRRRYAAAAQAAGRTVRQYVKTISKGAEG